MLDRSVSFVFAAMAFVASIAALTLSVRTVTHAACHHEDRAARTADKLPLSSVTRIPRDRFGQLYPEIAGSRSHLEAPVTGMDSVTHRFPPRGPLEVLEVTSTDGRHLIVLE